MLLKAALRINSETYVINVNSSMRIILFVKSANIQSVLNAKISLMKHCVVSLNLFLVIA